MQMTLPPAAEEADKKKESVEGGRRGREREKENLPSFAQASHVG